MVPDLDTIGFRFGVPYDDMLGHRGLSHSILFALLLGGVAAWALRARERQTRWQVAWLYLFLATMSHGILDAFTNGGHGVAFFAPFSNARYFFPLHPIRVSPIGSRFFSAKGFLVLKSEAAWIWMPSAIFAVVMWFSHKIRARNCRTCDMV